MEFFGDSLVDLHEEDQEALLRASAMFCYEGTSRCLRDFPVSEISSQSTLLAFLRAAAILDGTRLEEFLKCSKAICEIPTPRNDELLLRFSTSVSRSAANKTRYVRHACRLLAVDFEYQARLTDVCSTFDAVLFGEFLTCLDVIEKTDATSLPAAFFVWYAYRARSSPGISKMLKLFPTHMAKLNLTDVQLSRMLGPSADLYEYTYNRPPYKDSGCFKYFNFQNYMNYICSLLVSGDTGDFEVKANRVFEQLRVESRSGKVPTANAAELLNSFAEALRRFRAATPSSPQAGSQTSPISARTPPSISSSAPTSPRLNSSVGNAKCLTTGIPDDLLTSTSDT